MDFPTALDGYWLTRKRGFSQNTINDYDRTFTQNAYQPINAAQNF